MLETYSIEEIDKMSLNQKIAYSHEVRKNLMIAIVYSDIEEGERILKVFFYLMEHSDLGIMKRTDKELRSLKNILLSFNTLFSYSAELGGLNPVVSHYKSERYAIMIERAQTREEVRQIFNEYYYDYIDGNARIPALDKQTISNRVEDYIDKNFTNRLTIEEIASELYLSAAYLMRSFKKETGKTIQQRITEKRIQESCRLLATSNMNNTEISFIVGFNSPSYFSSIFKQYMKTTPKEYRNNIKSQYIDKKKSYS